MGAEATGADLSPGSGGQMGPSGSARGNRLFFSPQNNRVLTCSSPHSGGLINQTKVTHTGKKHLPTRLLIYKLGVMVLSGVTSSPERSDEWEGVGGDNRLTAF